MNRLAQIYTAGKTMIVHEIITSSTFTSMATTKLLCAIGIRSNLSVMQESSHPWCGYSLERAITINMINSKQTANIIDE